MGEQPLLHPLGTTIEAMMIKEGPLTLVPPEGLGRTIRLEDFDTKRAARNAGDINNDGDLKKESKERLPYTIVVIARHASPVIETNADGTPISYQTDVPLVALGQKEIQTLVTKLENRGIYPTRVYTSPAKRTVESAEAFGRLARTAPEEIIINSELRDVESQGGPFTYQELKEKGGEVYSREILEALDRRAVNTIKSILEQERGHTIIIFSHGDFIRVLRERFDRPDGSISPMKDMTKSNYLSPAEAWIMTFDEEGSSLSVDFVGQSSDIPHPRTYP